MDQPTAWLFPGHGSQYRGMGRGFPFSAPCVRSVFEEAESLSGRELRVLAVQGDADDLRDPELLEPMLAAFALACAALLQERGAQPAAVLGYSAGLLAALHCAGVITRDAALTLAVRRGRLLKDGAARYRGAMGAAVGLPAAQVCAAIAPLSPNLDVAGWNAPDHLTLVGDEAALRHAAASVQSAGGSWLPVEVAGAWHSTRAAPVAEQAAALYTDVAFSAPRLPLYCSVSGRRETDPARLRESLAQQLRRPVLWHAAVSALRTGERISRFVEVGCGRVLQSMTRRGAKGTTGGPIQFSSVHALE